MLLVRPAISFGFAIFIWQMLDKTGHPASALAVINLWAFVFIFIHAQRLLSRLYASTDLPALTLLPITEPTIFHWELQKCFRGSLWSLLDLLGGYTAVALSSHFTGAKWSAVIPISVAAWAEVLALAALCVAYLPRLPYQLASSSLTVIGFSLFMARNLVGSAVIGLIDRCAPSLNLLLPTGWPASVFQILLPDGRLVFIVLLVPIGATIWTFKNSFARLQSNFQFKEPILPEPPDLVPGADAETRIAAGTDQDRPPRLGPTAIEEIVQTRQFLATPAWRGLGWFEDLLWRWLNARERALAEFVFPSGLSIAAPWRKIFRNLAVTCLAAVTASFISPTGEYWILGGGLFVTVCQVLAQVLATGRAFQLVRCSGVNIPLYAAYPIGFRELGRLLFKCSLVQLPLLMPFAVISSILVFFLTNLSIVAGALFGIKAGGLIFVSRCIFVAFAFSSGTNDTSMVRLRSVVLLLFVVLWGLAFVALGGASLFVPGQYVAWLLWGLAAIDAYAFFRVYGWFYHRTRFDLMSLPQR
jgi:hypothetical protein